MAGTLKKLRFKLAWQNYRIGDEITPNGTLRDFLLAGGYCDVVPSALPDKPKGVRNPAQAAKEARGALFTR